MYLEKNKEIFDAELWAISKTLNTTDMRTKIGNTLINFFITCKKRLIQLIFLIQVQKTGFCKTLYTKKPENFKIIKIIAVFIGFQVTSTL